MENFIQGLYDKIKINGNFHSIDKLDIEQKFDFMELAIKSFENYELNLLEMANNGMISFEDYNNREQQPQFKQFENIAKEAKNKYFEQLALEPKKNKQFEAEQYDIETVNNYNKILNCNYHLLNSLNASKLFDVLQYSRNKVSDIALNHNFLGKNKSLQIIQDTNLVYKGAKEAHDKIEKKYNEIIITQTPEPTPEPIEPEIIDLSKDLDFATQKVVLMYELGIFDLLNQNPELNGNYKKISELVSAFTGVHPDTIRKPYELLEKETSYSRYNLNTTKNVYAINEIYRKIGLTRKEKTKGDTKGTL